MIENPLVPAIKKNCRKIDKKNKVENLTSNGWAQVGFRACAKNTFMLFALWSVAGYNYISRLYRGHALPHRFYNGRGLVAQNAK